jgi:uncharacterized protein YjbI with pentapeptide repeats
MTTEQWLLIFAGISATADFLTILQVIGIGNAMESERSQAASSSGRKFALPAILFMITMGCIGFSLYRINVLQTEPMHFAKTDIEHLKYVHGKNYFREEVVLDGMHFDHCTFDDVTLTYNGTDGIAFSNVTFSNIRFKNTSDSIGTAVSMLALFGFFKPGVPILGPDGNPMKPMPGAERVGAEQTH